MGKVHVIRPLPAKVKEFLMIFRITFNMYVIGYLGCSIHEKSYYISAYVAADKISQ